MNNFVTEWLQPISKDLRNFVEDLTVDEPTITQSVGISGERIWQVFDPRTRKLLTFESENQMLSWLDRNSSN